MANRDYSTGEQGYYNQPPQQAPYDQSYHPNHQYASQQPPPYSQVPQYPAAQNYAPAQSYSPQPKGYADGPNYANNRAPSPYAATNNPTSKYDNGQVGPNGERGLGTTVVGGAGGGFVGHEMGGGVIGTVLGSIVGAIGANALENNHNNNNKRDKPRNRRDRRYDDQQQQQQNYGVSQCGMQQSGCRRGRGRGRGRQGIIRSALGAIGGSGGGGGGLLGRR